MKCFQCKKPAELICTCSNNPMCRNHKIDHLADSYQHSLRNMTSVVPKSKKNAFMKAILHDLEHFEKIELKSEEKEILKNEFDINSVEKISLVKRSLRQIYESVDEYPESIIDRYLRRNRSFTEKEKSDQTNIDFYSQDFEKFFMAEQNKEFIYNHSTCIYSLVLSNDNKYAFVGCEDNTVRMWDLELNTLVDMFVGHYDRIYAVAITEDERFLVSGSNDKSIKVWALNTRRLYHEFLGHSLGIKCIETVNDMIVSGSFDKTIKIWSIQNLSELFTLNYINFGDIHSLKILKNSMTLLSGSAHKDIIIWDLRTGKNIGTIKTDKGVLSCIVSYNQRFFFTGHTEGEIIKWSFSNKAELMRFEIQIGRWITCLAITRDDQKLFSAEFADPLKFYNVIIIWDTNGNKLDELIGHRQWIYGLIVTNDDRHLISASMDCRIIVWLIEAGTAIYELKNTPINYLSLTFSLNGQYAVYGSLRYVVLYDILSFKMVYFTGHIDFVRGIAISNDNTMIVSGSFDGTIKVWYVDSPDRNYTLTVQDSPIYCLIITNDCKFTISGSHNGSIKVWDLNLKKFKYELQLEEPNNVMCLSQCNDESIIVCAFHSGKVEVWDFEQNCCVNFFKNHDVRIKSLMLSRDGSTILTSDITGKKVLRSTENIGNTFTIENDYNFYKDHIEFLPKFNRFYN